MRLFLPCIALLCLGGVAAAGDMTVPRYVEFRDGSVLRLQVVDEPCTLTVVRSTGRIEPLTVRLSELEKITLTPEQDFAKKRALLSAVQKLGAEDFREREQAQASLLAMPPGIASDLEACLQLTSDPEIQARLKYLLSKTKRVEGEKAFAVAFDRFQLKEPCWGYLGDTGIPVEVDGVKHRLTRQDVSGMTVGPPAVLGLAATQNLPPGFRRIAENEFPPNCVEEGFERTPEGRPLQIGENIEKLFVSKGFVLSTSVTTSFVSVNSFTVQGKSRGLSAATHNPLWTGEITITFIQPGQEKIPAGVTHFGCYIAAIMPQGTSLTAYDMQGRELGTIHTEREGTEFLGVRSSVPMHRIRIVPNVNIDRDYTLDDFIFAPAHSTEFAHPSRYTVQLVDGDRVLCSDVSLSRESVHLHGLPGGLPDRTQRLAQVQRINAPRVAQPLGQEPPVGMFAELRDGSVIFGSEPPDRRGVPLFTRRPQTLKEKENLVGLWSAAFPRMTQAPKGTPAVVWNEAEKRWQGISYVRMLEEAVIWKVEDGSFAAQGYRKLAPLWFSTPAAGPAPGSWHVRTTQGEDLVLAGADTISGRLSREVEVVWQGHALRLPATEVVSIYQAQKNGGN